LINEVVLDFGYSHRIDTHIPKELTLLEDL